MPVLLSRNIHPDSKEININLIYERTPEYPLGQWNACLDSVYISALS